MQPHPVPHPENRLAGFNAERAAIVNQVAQRVVEGHIARAERRQEDSLEYVLNECAFSEIRRLEKSESRENKKRLARWHELAHKLGAISELDKRRELEAIVRYHAQDIAGNFNPRVYRFAKDVLPSAVSFLLSPVSGFREGLKAFGALSETIRVEGPISTLRTCCQRGTLVLTPTHSSNLDSILLGFALNRTGLPPVTYGAGKNLFSNPFMTFFMENLGAYRVDRRLQYSLYKEVLKEYSTVLLERGYHSLFFPGGTRARSNQVESKLKLGLLGTTATALGNRLRAGSDARIYIVPMTINYRLVLEAETLIEDYLADTGKSRYIIEDDEFSRLGKLIEFARKTLAHEGASIVRFGEPLDAFGNAVDEEGESRDAQGRIVDPAGYLRDARGEFGRDEQRDMVYTRLLGTQLGHAYRRNTIFMGTHLVARAWLQLVRQRTGISDILRLMRLSSSALRVQMDELCWSFDNLRTHVDKHPDSGRLDSAMQGRAARDIIDSTLRHMASYHTKPVLFRSGQNINCGSMKLLYYYQNRCEHLPAEVSR